MGMTAISTERYIFMSNINKTSVILNEKVSCGIINYALQIRNSFTLRLYANAFSKGHTGFESP
jgi:hypothetical protein